MVRRVGPSFLSFLGSQERVSDKCLRSLCLFSVRWEFRHVCFFYLILRCLSFFYMPESKYIMDVAVCFILRLLRVNWLQSSWF